MQWYPGLLEALSPLNTRVPSRWTRCADQSIALYQYDNAADTTKHYIVGTNDLTLRWAPLCAQTSDSRHPKLVLE